MPEYKYAKGRILDSIRFISDEMREFQEDYAGKNRKNYQDNRKLQKLMDRTVENILTALIETCGTFLAQKGIAAESYADALSRCAGALGLSEDEQDRLGSLAMSRNRLAHRYLNFRWQAIEDLSKNRGLVAKMAGLILKKEEEGEKS